MSLVLKFHVAKIQMLPLKKWIPSNGPTQFGSTFYGENMIQLIVEIKFGPSIFKCTRSLLFFKKPTEVVEMMIENQP